MRRGYIALVAAVALSAAILAVVVVTQPQAHAQRHNAYWPYSVETAIRDR